MKYKTKRVRKILTKEFLKREYLLKNKTSLQIARETKLSCNTVKTRLKRFQIKKSQELIYQLYRGKNNPNYNNHKLKGCKRPDVNKNLKGRKRPDISKANKGKHKGKNNSMYIDGRSLKKYYCIDCKKKISYKSIRCAKCNSKFLSGKNSPTYGKIYHGKWGVYKGIKMRSSYEIKFAYFLDLSGHKWLYEPKTFDLGETTYTPDFYLPEFNCYIEIKGYWRDDAKKKFKEFKKKYFNLNIQLFDIKRLEKTGLLDL